MPTSRFAPSLTAGAAVLVALALTTTGCADSSADSSAGAPLVTQPPVTLTDTPTLVGWSTTRAGVRATFSVLPATDRTYGPSPVLRGEDTLAWAQLSYAQVPPVADPAAWKQEHPIGTAEVEVEVTAVYRPDCQTDRISTPVIALRWTEGDEADGAQPQLEKRFSTLTPVDHAAAVRRWCDGTVRVRVQPTEFDASGGFRVPLTIHNDTTEPVQISSPRWRATSTLTWQPVTARVPAHATRVISVRGVGTCAAPAPFQNGWMEIDGEPLELSGTRQLCGTGSASADDERAATPTG